MKDPRHLFILIGLLAQALTWDSFAATLLVFALWILSTTVLQGRIRATLTTEAVALIIGCILSGLISYLTSRSAHFFIGDGLVLLQLVRITRQLSVREKLTALIVAAFHFGVLCTLSPNVRFLALFLAAVVVFPAALKKLFGPGSSEEELLPNAARVRVYPSFRVAFWLLFGSAFAFAVAPRFSGSPLQLHEPIGYQGSLLDSILDARGGGQANSQQVLLQIDGDQVGYLRAFALTETDGITWRTDPKASILPHKAAEGKVVDSPRHKKRAVFVRNPKLLGKNIPVDGWPAFMQRNFFDGPFENRVNGAIECTKIWSTENNEYYYWIDPTPQPQPLAQDLRVRLARYPEASPRLKQWVEGIASKGTNDLQRARLLELYLRRNFTYKLGSPDLNRFAPIEDFIFNRKEGHCERFASSLALFLRMQGIPSRVVVGYVPVKRNLFTGRILIRFCDAHSWTEGYIENQGWVTFDATPGPPVSVGSDLRDYFDALDFAWYSYIVNFNGFAQKHFFRRSAEWFEQVSPRSWNQVGYVIMAVLFAAITVHFGSKIPFSLLLRCRSPRTAQARARHYYDEMLLTLENRGLPKRPEQTPREFVEKVSREMPRKYNDALAITELFCQSFYGQKPLSTEEQARARVALGRIKEQPNEKTHSVERS